MQRHKQRASCSGKRDPAAKVAKSELATPAAFDRDYNFLTGVEKYLGNAHDRSRELLAIQDTASVRSSKIAEFARDHHLRIIRAPKGMSRQLINNTRWNSKNHCISWTVEVISPDRSSATTTGNDSESITQVHQYLLRHGPRRPREEPKSADRKRKRELATAPATSVLSEEEPRMHGEDSEKTEADGQGVDTTSALTSIHEAAEGPRQHPREGQDHLHDPQQLGKEAVNVSEREEQGKATEVSKPVYHYYLVKPLTSCPETVLIPIKGDSKLSESLENQTILEYPTIQVLFQTADELPAGFITESEYETQQQQLIAEMETELAPLELEAKQEELRRQREADMDGAFNDASILASIQRDSRR